MLLAERWRLDDGIVGKGQRLTFTRHGSRDSYYLSIHILRVLHGHSNGEGRFE